MPKAETPEERLHMLLDKIDPAYTKPRKSDLPPKKYPKRGLHWKGRKRVQKASTIAGLEAYRKNGFRSSLAFSEGTGIKRCCKCRRVAVKNADVCYWHGGSILVWRRKLAEGILPPRHKAVKSNVQMLLKTKSVPDELARLPVYVNAYVELRELIGRVVAIRKNKTEPEPGERAFLTRRQQELYDVLYRLNYGWARRELNPSDMQHWTDALDYARSVHVSLD